MRNVLIIGASGGIGRAMVSAVQSRHPDCNVLKAQRSTADGSILLDLEDPDSIARAANLVKEQVDFLDCVINAAGLLHDDSTAPEKAVHSLESATLQRYFAVNATGPAIVARHFWRLLSKAPGRAVLASLAARVGSIGDNRLGGWYGYRSSKAALVMLNRTLAIEMRRRAPRMICVCLHPGTVDTPLSRPFQQNVPSEKLFTSEQSANHLLNVIDGLTPDDSGKHIAWDGKPIPW